MERLKQPCSYPTATVAYTAPLLVPYARAREHGITDRQLLNGSAPAILRGVHEHPTRTVVRFAPEWADDDWREQAQRVRALAMLRPDALPAGPTAAKLIGVPLPWDFDLSTLHVVIPAGAHRTRLTDVCCRASRFHNPQTHYGLPANHPLFTLLELACHLHKRALVQCIDGMTGHWHGPPLTTTAEIRRLVGRYTGYRGRRKLIPAADLARDHTRSPKETDWRLRIVDAGMPEPIPNWSIPTGPNSFRELDLAFVDFKVAGSYQGYDDHLRLAEQVARDGARSVDVQRAGWLEVPITRVYEPEYYLRQLREALLGRGWKP